MRYYARHADAQDATIMRVYATVCLNAMSAPPCYLPPPRCCFVARCAFILPAAAAAPPYLRAMFTSPIIRLYAAVSPTYSKMFYATPFIFADILPLTPIFAVLLCRAAMLPLCLFFVLCWRYAPLLLDSAIILICHDTLLLPPPCHAEAYDACRAVISSARRLRFFRAAQRLFARFAIAMLPMPVALCYAAYLLSPAADATPHICRCHTATRQMPLPP